jgi:uncharacterized RDD family membrane protein YckC
VSDPTGPPSSVHCETASWGRRALALVVDWFTCLLVVQVLVTTGVLADNPAGIYTLLVFVAESAVLTALAGGSFGKLATRLRVVRVDGSGRPIDLLRSLLRAVLVGLLVPPLVFRPDGRGLHDMLVGSITVPLDAARR